MRSFTLVMLLLASSLASAANLRFTFVATDGTVVVNSPTITAPQESILIDWLWEFYAPVDTTPGSPTLGQKLTRTPANEAQAYRNWAASSWAGTASQVRRWKREKDQAAIAEPMLPGE